MAVYSWIAMVGCPVMRAPFCWMEQVIRTTFLGVGGGGYVSIVADRENKVPGEGGMKRTEEGINQFKRCERGLSVHK